MIWDVFCQVIDNYGDIGVCWRLSCHLADRGEQVRLWVDDVSALAWMAPALAGKAPGQERVQVLMWAPGGAQAPPAPRRQSSATWPQPGDVVIEAFGCALPDGFVGRMALQPQPPAWINLEYLSAEPFVERCHGLPSPVLHGPGAGLVKHFFYPGFTDRTGGLLREPELAQRQSVFDRGTWLTKLGLALDTSTAARWVSLFCYEPAALPALLAELERSACPARPIRLLVTSGRAELAVKSALTVSAGNLTAALSPDDLLHENSFSRHTGGHSSLSISYLPKLSQADFDHLLWACDLNFVRGEDSLVRAIWAGKPLVWQVYPQHDNAHHAKLNAFLGRLDASVALCEWHQAWNGLDATAPPLDDLWNDRTVTAARRTLMGQEDLATQLIRFIGRLTG